MKRLAVVWLILVLALAGLSGPAASGAETDPVKVTADSFTVTEGNREAVFSGNVVVTQPGLTITTQKLVVHYSSGQTRQIESLDVLGGVRLVSKEQTITGDKGVYDPKTRVMTVTGNVVVVNANGTVKGPALTVDLRTNTASFTKSGGGRVSGVFNP